MKKKSIQFLFALLLIIISGFTTSENIKPDPNIIPFKWKNVNGIILTKDYLMPPTEEKISRFTPTKEDIIAAEIILKKNIKKMNSSRMNQFGHCPVIHRHLKDYFRQYVGVINEKGEKVIHINCLWNKYTIWDRIRGYSDQRDGYKDGYTTVFDGCSYYWSVNANLAEKKLFSLDVNGVA